MAAIQTVLVNGVFLSSAGVPTPLYTSPVSAAPISGLGTLISAFTIANGASANISYKAWVVPSGSSVGDEFLLVPARTVKALKTDVPYEVVSHLMPPSSTLYVEYSTANSAGIRVTGVELSE